MSHAQYASPLRVELKPSNILIAIVSILHIGAVIIVTYSSVSSVAVKLILIAAITSTFIWFLFNSGKLQYSGTLRLQFPLLISVVWNKADNWILQTTDGQELVAEMVGHSFVHPWLTVVKLKIVDKPWYYRYRTLLFLADNIDAEIFRRLRVRLRWYSTQNPDNSEVPG